ncbi:MAG: hypothetical protein IJ320_04090, partial [Phascolarctobacterium sp.]|nr:hypothetical protein [Phascolarctobacterium sp.]
MSKKMLKRSLALGALMAFVITGSAMASQIVDQNLTVSQDTTIITDSFNENTFGNGNRTVALGYTNGTDNTVTIADDTTLQLVNELEGATRSYGIVVHNPDNGASLNVIGGTNSVVDLDIDVDNRAEGVRNNYNGTLNINVGLLDVNVKTTGDADVTYGMDVWQGTTTNINTTSGGITKFNVEAVNGKVYGIQGWREANVYEDKNGAVVNINDLELIVKGSQEVSVLRAINLHDTTMNLEGNSTKITLNNEGEQLAGAIVVLQGNHEDSPTTLNFNAITTALNATGGNGNNSVSGVTSSGGSSVINFNGESVSIDIDGGNAAVIGVNAQYQGNTINTSARTSIVIDVESSTAGDVKGVASRLYSGSSGEIDFKGATDITAINNGSGLTYGVYAEDETGSISLADTTITATGAEGRTRAIYLDKGARGIVDGDVTITATSGYRAEAVDVRGGSSLTLGKDNTSKISVTSTTMGDAPNLVNTGIQAYQNGSNVTINADTLDVTVTGTGSAWAYGISANTAEVDDESSSVTINANKTTITTTAAKEGKSSAIVAMSDGEMTINGDLTAKGDYVLLTRGQAATVINESGEGTVQLDGDINFNYGYYNYGSATNEIGENEVISNDINADVNINLVGENSYLNGNISTSITKFVKDENGVWVVEVTEENSNERSLVNGMNLSVSNGAQWTATDDSFANNLTLANGGKVTMAGDEAMTISVDSLSGADGIIETNNLENKFSVVNSDATGLTVNGTAEIADAIANGESELQGLADVVSVTSGTGVATVTTEEGLVGGAYSAQVDKYGKVVTETITQQVNTKSDAVSDAGMALKAHWRAHMNDMNKRMGDLRMANGETGVWTRMVRGESEYQGAKMQYNQYQLGYDEKLSVDKRWTVGAAVTFSEGDASYGYGSTDDKSTAFA